VIYLPSKWSVKAILRIKLASRSIEYCTDSYQIRSNETLCSCIYKFSDLSDAAWIGVELACKSRRHGAIKLKIIFEVFVRK
jgi:hypothetical protein